MPRYLSFFVGAAFLATTVHVQGQECDIPTGISDQATCAAWCGGEGTYVGFPGVTCACTGTGAGGFFTTTGNICTCPGESAVSCTGSTTDGIVGGDFVITTQAECTAFCCGGSSTFLETGGVLCTCTDSVGAGGAYTAISGGPTVCTPPGGLGTCPGECDGGGGTPTTLSPVEPGAPTPVPIGSPTTLAPTEAPSGAVGVGSIGGMANLAAMAAGFAVVATLL